MTPVLPPPRKIPVVPRPRHGELSGSYLARVARANRTDLRSFLGLLGSLPSALANEPADLPIMVLTLNEAAFTRLIAYTGQDGEHLIRAVPSLAPRAVSPRGESAAIRLSYVKALAADCPGCRLRREGAHADTRLISLKTACLRHGYWLFGQGSGQRVNLAAIPEVAAAQHRLERVASRRGPTAAMRAYEIASGYLQHSWRIDSHPLWYSDLVERWHRRARAAGATPARVTWQFPGWVVHPECTAIAAVFASPYWAALAVPAPDRRHRLFYQRLLVELAVGDTPLRTMRTFDPLPRDIQEQARWGRHLNDPDWGAPPPAVGVAEAIPFIDITDDYERSIRALQTAEPTNSAARPALVK
jgi:hypothetical protein